MTGTNLHRERAAVGDLRARLSEKAYGIPPEQVVGSASSTRYGYGKDGKPFLTKEPKLLLNDNNAGKPEGIHLLIGRRPSLSVGNSTGDRQMLEYATAGKGARLAMLVLHDDATREYAYGPAQGSTTPRSAPSPGALRRGEKERLDRDGMKDDWKKIFAFEWRRSATRGRDGRPGMSRCHARRLAPRIPGVVVAASLWVSGDGPDGAEEAQHPRHLG